MSNRAIVVLICLSVMALFVLAACQAAPPEPLAATPRSPDQAATPQVVTVRETVPVEVTRLATVVVIVTATPVPSPTPRPTVTPWSGDTPPSVECARTAVTQFDLNNCAAMRADEARMLLLQAISRNPNLSVDPEFAVLEQQWEEQTRRELQLLLLKTEGGAYVYGTMAPLLYYSCEYQRFKDRYEELRDSACGGMACTEAEGFPEWTLP